MRKEYDLKKLNLKPNPYLDKLKKRVTIRIDADVVEYFKSLGEKLNMPYQTLMNDYLRNCKEEKISPKTIWKKAG